MKMLRNLALAALLGTAALLGPAPADAFTYSTALKSARMGALPTTWGNSALLKIIDTGGSTVCATFTLSATASDSSTGGTDTLTIKFTGNSASQTVTASAACTATSAKIQTSGAVDVVTGLTVGTSGSNINLNNTSITNGQSVTISAASIQHAP